MVGETGLEPAASCSQSKHSSQLSYSPTWRTAPETSTYQLTLSIDIGGLTLVLFILEERVGVEPTEDISAFNCFQDSPIQPLWHLSIILTPSQGL